MAKHDSKHKKTKMRNKYLLTRKTTHLQGVNYDIKQSEEQFLKLLV